MTQPYRREVFGIGPRYEEVTVIFHDETSDYPIIQRDNGEERICHKAMGTWAVMTPMDLIYRLRLADRYDKART